MDVLAPSLAVVLVWMLVATLLAGCGFLTRRALLRFLRYPRVERLSTADLWIGLALLLAYLQVWSLFLAISRAVWIAPVAAGIVGVVVGARRTGPLRPTRRSAAVLALVGVGTLWAANQSLAAAHDYDFGLYHLSAIHYALQYPAIPGLANLHDRLGASDAHLLLVAFLDRGPWGHAGLHFASGLLVSMLFVEVTARFARAPRLRSPSSFTRRLALLIVPATIVVVGKSPSERLASPSLDVAAFVLTMIGSLYLAECFEHDFPPAAALTATASFAAASATRPFYWLPTTLAIVLILVGVRRARANPGLRVTRTLILVSPLPGALLIGWLGRQAVLSGYPLFPSTFIGLPVDWRLPAGIIHSASRWDESWARVAGANPATVLNSWHWLSSWLPQREHDIDVIAPLALLACLVPAFLGGRLRDPGRTRRLVPMLAVLTPAVATLILWFLFLPDPRFALAPLWLVPIALVAWALPDLGDRWTPWLLVVAAALALGLAIVGIQDFVWLLPVVLCAWALVAVVTRLATGRQAVGVVAGIALVSLALAPVAIIANNGAFALVHSNHGGTLGTAAEQVAAVTAFRTASGLEIWYPAAGSDQCFAADLCTPYPNFALRLRGSGVRDGFTLAP